jgi:hypothetical protein
MKLDLVRSTRHSYPALDFKLEESLGSPGEEYSHRLLSFRKSLNWKDSEIAMTTVYQLPVWMVEDA